MRGYVELFFEEFLAEGSEYQLGMLIVHPAPKVYPVFESQQKRPINQFLNYSFLIFTKFYIFTA
jgi:hypothetical protein